MNVSEETPKVAHHPLVLIIHCFKLQGSSIVNIASFDPTLPHFVVKELSKASLVECQVHQASDHSA